MSAQAHARARESPDGCREDFASASPFLHVCLGARRAAERWLQLLDALVPAVDRNPAESPEVTHLDPGGLAVLGSVALALKVLETTGRLAAGAPEPPTAITPDAGDPPPGTLRELLR
ncbi:MAG: hypothetical protein HY909_18530 [Deltaproteobacteria bacterium]|nr:hypothetical protein [Deltaproteobacteria bacterium]